MAKSKLTDAELLEEAVVNIREDRGLTYELINELRADLATSRVTHKEVGFTAAKYMETLQRSNEQLVRLTALVHKIEEDSKDSDRMTQEDLEELYDGMNTKR
jgi:transposase